MIVILIVVLMRNKIEIVSGFGIAEIKNKPRRRGDAEFASRINFIPPRLRASAVKNVFETTSS